MGYPVCPKCGHAPLPADQSLPAACPACGIVLAKFASMLTREEREEARAEEVKRTSLAGWLFHVPDAVAKANWYGRIAALVLFGLYTIKIFRDTDIKYGDLGGLFMSGDCKCTPIPPCAKQPLTATWPFHGRGGLGFCR